jgi:hypothetical protein
MQYPQPAQQDLQQLLTTLEGKNLQLEALREHVNYELPEVQYQDKDGGLRLYTSLCTNLSSQLCQYMRLRRLILLPYLKDLLDKEEDGHDCKACGGGCQVQHASHTASIREAHAALRELLEHIQPMALSLSVSKLTRPDVYHSLRADMLQMEQCMNEVLFIEETALIPMMEELQRNIGAYE